MTALMEQRCDAEGMVGVRHAADLVRLHPKLVRLTSGWPVITALPGAPRSLRSRA